MGALLMSFLARNLQLFVRQNLPDGGLPDTLYHYTNIDVLKILFQDKQDLYAKHCSFCDKQGEIIPACKAFTDYLVRQEIFTKQDEQRANEFIIEKIAAESPDVAERNSMLPWITCFSSDGDSTYHWRIHTQEGNGCAILFNRTCLDWFIGKMADSYNINPLCSDAVILSPCYYIGGNNVDGLFDVFIKEYKEDFCKLNQNDDCFRGCIATIVLSSAMVKMRNFVPEKEWRLIRWFSDVRLARQLSSRINGKQVLQWNGLEIPREFVYAGLADVRAPFREWIQGVTVSPSSMDRLGEVKELFSSANIPFVSRGERSIIRIQRTVDDTPQITWSLNLSNNRQWWHYVL